MSRSHAVGEPRREPAPLLDAQLIRERRMELGLSERKLSEKLGAGVSQSVVRGIEAGTNHADLTLGDLRRLAATLDLPLGLLMAEQARATGDVDPAGPVTEDEHVAKSVARVAAILVELDRAVPVQVLAELMALTLDELERTLVELDARLAPSGLRVQRVRGEIFLRSANPGLPAADVREAWRRHFARRGLDISRARLLYRALRENPPKTVGENERLKGAALVNAGILERTGSGGLALTPAATFSMPLPVASTHPG